MDQNNELSLTISGFGEFYGIKVNPTGVIVSEFTKEFMETYNIVRKKELEVSILACNQYVESLPDYTLNIHFGVSEKSKEFNIEQRAINLKHFTIPDMRNYQPLNEPIEYQYQKQCYRETKINTKELVKILQQYFPVKESTDSGTYMCNYLYYCSLQKSQECSESCLFIHFPTFDTILKEIQMVFVENLLGALHMLHQNGKLYK